MEDDEKRKVNAVVGRIVTELLMSHDIVSCELLIKVLHEHREKTSDEGMRLQYYGIIRSLLKTLH